MIAPCAVVSEEMIAFLCPDDDRRALLSAGGGHARIYGPDGRELVMPLGENEEGLLIAELDPAAIIFAKMAADPVGHYSRPDVTRLLFNPSANKTVVKRHSPPEPFAEQAEEEEEE